MSTATASDLTVPLIGGRNHFLLRRLHSLTGLVFGGYLIVHLLVNATIAQGGGVYQAQVNKIHDLPFLPVIEWTFIYLPMIYHTIYGIWITLTGQPNVQQYSYYRNWLYTLQRVSAIYLAFFMLFHVLAFKYGWFGTNLSFDAHQAMGTVGRHFDTSSFVTWIVYPLGVLASTFHLANGFWAAAVTWGLAVSAGGQKRWGYVCIALFVLLFVAGMIALVAGAALPTAELLNAPQVTVH